MSTRISLELNDTQAELLARLQNIAGLDKKTDVFNNALTLLGWVVSEISKGREIASVDETNEVYRQIKMPFFENIKKN